MLKISVIVPVYNVEKYLKQCIDSILTQTMNDIEIICVDDGSTDDSGAILDWYGEKDSRVKVIHKKNAGYGAAINTGIDAAQGEYIGIVESDDCIKPEMYQILYNEAVKDDLDLVKSDAFYWIEEHEYMMKIHYQWLDDYYNRTLYDEDRNIFFDFFMNIWTGIYKRTFLLENEIRFNESPGASYQDNGFWLQTLLYCRRAKWISQAFYLYRQDNPEASVKSKSKVMAMTMEYEFLEKNLYDRKDYHLLPYCYYYKFFRHMGTFTRIEDEYKRSFCEQIKKDYAAYKGYIKGNVGMERWMHEASVSPDKLCDEAISKRQAVRSRLETSENIIIYGAGKHGNIVFRWLYNEGYYDKICCFAVSHFIGDEYLAEKRILMINDAHKLYPNALVIIAVVHGSEMYYQMVENLANLNVVEYINGSDIEENFYIV